MFCCDPYDRERYEAIRQLAARMFAARTDALVERIEALFAGETGYPTPKVDVRAAVFDDDDHILMVRETSDGGHWTLPSGWADVNRTAAQNAAKEALEESGFEVEPLKLAAVWDRTKQGHAPLVFSCCKFFFLCALIGGQAATSHETSEVGWFHEADISADLSLERIDRETKSPLTPAETDALKTCAADVLTGELHRQRSRDRRTALELCPTIYSTHRRKSHRSFQELVDPRRSPWRRETRLVCPHAE